jgi:hypothetical protein
VSSTPQVVLQIVSPEKSDMYPLFYDTGKGFNETESVRHTVDKGEVSLSTGFFQVAVKESLLPE